MQLEHLLLPRTDTSTETSTEPCIQCPTVAPQCDCPSTQRCTIIGQSCVQCPTVICSDPDAPQQGGSSGISKGALAGGIVGVLALLTITVLLFFWYRRRQRALEAHEKGGRKHDIPASASAVLSRPDPVEKVFSPPPHHAPLPPSEGDAVSGVRMYSGTSNSTINLDPDAQDYPHSSSGPVRRSVQSNPFTDTHSIQTATTSDLTQSTNVIPIALVPHASGSQSSPAHSRSTSLGQSQQSQGGSSRRISGSPSDPNSPFASSNMGSPRSSTSAPSRPPRSPDLNIRLDPLAGAVPGNYDRGSFDAAPPHPPFAPNKYAGSTMSSRASYMTSASSVSDVLHEAPQIVTPDSGVIRQGQVLGVVKAEVVRAPVSLSRSGSMNNGSASASGSSSSYTNSTPPTPLTPDSPGKSQTSRSMKFQSTRSPLAQAAFGPDMDTVYEDIPTGNQSEDGSHPNPFADEPQLPRYSTITRSPTSSTRPDVADLQGETSWHTRQWSGDSTAASRPVSSATAAGSIIVADIGSVTRVHMGLTPNTAQFSPAPSSADPLRSANRMTSAKLVSTDTSPLTTPSSSSPTSRGDPDGHLQAQQAQAMARVRGPGMFLERRTSDSSVASAGTDSLLESFAFVPPAESPIAQEKSLNSLNGRGAGRAGRSPLSQQSFTAESTSLSTPALPVPPLPNFPAAHKDSMARPHAQRLPRNMSTVSHASSTASGAGSAFEGYPFRIDSENRSPYPSGSGSDTPPSGYGSSVAVDETHTTASSGRAPIRGRNSTRASLDTLALTQDLSAFPLPAAF